MHQTDKPIAVQAGGAPPPLKNIQHPLCLKKFDSTSLSEKRHKGFSWQKSKNVFRPLAKNFFLLLL